MSSTINLALGKPAFQSSICTWSMGRTREEDAAFANDGVLDREHGNHTDLERSPWWRVDLGDEYVIDRICLYNRCAHAERLSRFSVLVSLDGVTWRSIFRKANLTVFGASPDEPFVIDVKGAASARWVKIRSDADQVLHIRECQVFGRLPSPGESEAARRDFQAAEAEQEAFASGRSGHTIEIGGFEVFADTGRYSPAILGALQRGEYEARERELLLEIIRPGDRVLEVGTAIGVVSMTAATAAGPANVVSYEANPHIVADARRNFAHNGLDQIRAVNAVLKSRARGADAKAQTEFHISRDFWASRLDASAGSEDIVEVIQVPTLCLEDELKAHGANLLICDIEGGEVDLLIDADLSGVATILLETHYWATGKRQASALVRKLVQDGFDIDLGLSGRHVTVFMRDLT
ncbi:FkbM family methyltransferase [Caulobacter sp. S45]|uniref:FkbM family methyltransferase n=1 Tax=Caulobacter sp. S45 TaxID=1641861 RepID=UPI0015753B99|nr:FkbM family methyltransferase [Caulobacter sp. S45]